MKCSTLALIFFALILHLWLTPESLESIGYAASPQMYVSGMGNNKIVWANLDGSGGTDLGNPGGFLNIPHGIALDSVNGKMYIASSGNNKIVRQTWTVREVLIWETPAGSSTSPVALRSTQ